MKKLILGFLLLVGLVSNSVAGPATKAYYWTIYSVGSTEHDVQYGQFWEDTWNDDYSTDDNHGGYVVADVIILGYSNSLVVTFNGSNMQLLRTEAIHTDYDNIVDGWRYYYGAYGESGTIEVRDINNYSYQTVDRIHVR